MKATSEGKALWTCPKCKRQFSRRGQSHSCRHFPLEQHFKNRAISEHLYQKLVQALEKQIGPFKTESLECCIHLVSSFTFAVIRIMKNKLRIEFTLTQRVQSERFKQVVQLSARRHLYYVDATTESEIDQELIQWIQAASTAQ